MSLSLNEWIAKKKENIIENEILKEDRLVELMDALWGVIFPGFSDIVEDSETYFDLKINQVKKNLNVLLSEVSNICKEKVDDVPITEKFLQKLPEIDEMIHWDLEAIFDGDPAAECPAEIILCYPGLFAIFIYRIAHTLFSFGVPILPRALSEYAHGKTGIDIHPGATIGHHFFIDHGTGIVIGETTVIGDYVKLYQGVTLGALSLREGQQLKGKKRHPTIEDHVTIYSGASIFGGDTIIGKNTTIGSSTFITSSIDADMVVTIVGQRKKKDKNRSEG